MTPKEDKTLHQRILHEIQNNILSGIWLPKHRLPFEVDLAKHYGCSRMTVNKVMTQLAAAGMVERKRKSGTFVRMPQSQSAILPINEIATEVATMGLSYSWNILEQEKRKAKPEERQKLDLRQGDVVLAISCLHLANARPFCLERRLINLQTVPNAENVDFKAIAPGNWLIETVPWSTADNRIAAVLADLETSRILQIAERDACLLVERLTRNHNGIVTKVNLLYAGDRHSIVAQFEPKLDRIPTTD
ncbi:histidine utilization repressor [Bartonella sp. CB169]|uniref:histidine utilization repressor n=1 Tax=Bartonella sp. CB169 TaxID=3112257 RepID=UPI00300DCCCF